MPQLFSNNAETALGAQLTVGATTLQVATNFGSLFRGPNPALGEYELITLANNTFQEIVKCTQRGALVPEVKYATPSGVISPGSSIFYLDLTDDTGTIATISFVSADSSVSGAVTGLFNAWQAQAVAPWTDYTVADAGTHLRVERDTAGVGFTLAGRTTGGGELLTVTTPPASDCRAR